jgi:hypothetical protein
LRGDSLDSIQHFVLTLQFLEQLPVTVFRVLGVSQVLGKAECAGKINPPYLPILANQHVGEVGIVGRWMGMNCRRKPSVISPRMK